MKDTSSQSPPQDCTSVRRLSTPFVDGELDASEQGAVEGHLKGCEACRRFFEHERALDGFLRGSLAKQGKPGPALQARVIAALRPDEPARPRTWARVLAMAALLLLGAFIGSVGTASYSAGDAELSGRLSQLCDVAREALPDTRVQGGYEEAAADYKQLFAESALPRPGGGDAPKPRLYGSVVRDNEDVHWVVYCTGEPGFPERFVLLTTRESCLASALAGLQSLELDADDLRVLVWRDKDRYHMLVTRREADWARRQQAALTAA